MITTDQEGLIKCEPDSIIWRYMDLNKFDLLLSEKSLFFCRSDKFSDPYEASIPKREVENRIIENMRIAEFYNNTPSFASAKKNSDDMRDLHLQFKKAFIVNCWHINSTESDAMWRLYLKSNEGVAIQTSHQNLSNSLNHNKEEIFISKVRYIDYEKDIWYHEETYPFKSYNLFTPIIHKRKAFIHENELRVIQQIGEAIDKSNYWLYQPNTNGKNVSCDIDLLIDKIILPPTAEDDVQTKVESILEKYSVKKEIIKSKLNDPPFY